MSPRLKFEVIPVDAVPVPFPPKKGDAQGPVILVVDDERVIADTLSIILSKNGFSAFTAYDANAALEMAKAVPPALLLSDVMMGPGMDGSQLAMAIVESFPECRVILFSGHGATRDLLDRARDQGHDFTLLSKPLHPADLLAHIAESFAAGPVAAKV
jgi:DNA-binding NtrC family response regulator